MGLVSQHRLELAGIALIGSALFLFPTAGRPPGQDKTAQSIRNEAHGERTDAFGGVVMSPSEPQGMFHVKQIGHRWVFITPEGNPMWLRAVYAVDWNDGGTQSAEALKTKYQGKPVEFARHAALRLKAWGFNALGEYHSSYLNPLPTYSRREGNAEKLPFIRLLNISWYGSFNSGDFAPAPFKTLLAGAVDPSVYHGWPGHIPDVFDPNFAIYARGVAGDVKTRSHSTIFTAGSPIGGVPNASLSKSPWLLGTTPDDADNLFGFGPGPELTGSDKVIHPHIGWVIAVTRSYQNQNDQVGAAFGNKKTVTYSDPVVYAKKAWRDYLENKYKTIASLNRAWGSSYTTFDSDGGWPNGRGLMDESGHSRWIGQDPLKLATASPQVVVDLNAFLKIYAEKYFQTVSDAIRAATPNHLVFSPAVLDSHGGLTRKEILEAAGEYCDVIQIVANPDNPEAVARTYALSHKPMFSWMGLRADQDSAVQGLKQQRVTLPSQAERGEKYRHDVSWMYSYRTPDGTYPIMGIDWWEYMDKWGEKANWGLVTPRDNAYDGKEDDVAESKDEWGIVVGGEKRDFGDFLGSVRAENLEIDKQLHNEARNLTVDRQSRAGKNP